MVTGRERFGDAAAPSLLRTHRGEHEIDLIAERAGPGR